jgi:hypothetical protein
MVPKAQDPAFTLSRAVRHKPIEHRMPHHSVVGNLCIRNLSVEARLGPRRIAFLIGWAKGALGRTRGSGAIFTKLRDMEAIG